jgi:hypothetical protein
MARTVTVQAQYSYQAWSQAHAQTRSNVRLVSVTGETYVFETTTEERWPVAAKHYRSMALWSYRNAAAAMDPEERADYLERALCSRINVFDAETGCVTDLQTLDNFTL